MDEIHKLGFTGIIFLRKMYGLTELNIWMKEEVRHRVGVREKLSDRVNRKFFKRFRHVERMHGERLARRVHQSEVEGRRDVRSRHVLKSC